MIGSCALASTGGCTIGIVVNVGANAEDAKPWAMTAGHAFEWAKLKDGKLYVVYFTFCFCLFALRTLWLTQPLPRDTPHKQGNILVICPVAKGETECEYCRNPTCEKCWKSESKKGTVIARDNDIFNFFNPDLFATRGQHDHQYADFAVFPLGKAKLTPLEVSTCQKVIEKLGMFSHSSFKYPKRPFLIISYAECDPSRASEEEKKILKDAQKQFKGLSGVGFPMSISELRELKADKKPLYLFMKGMKTGWIFCVLSEIDTEGGFVFGDPFNGVPEVPISNKGDSGALWFGSCLIHYYSVVRADLLHTQF